MSFYYTSPNFFNYIFWKRIVKNGEIINIFLTFVSVIIKQLKT